MIRVAGSSVISPQAEIPLLPLVRRQGSGIPAFAGMTEERVTTK
jgi:hypothetical protein